MADVQDPTASTESNASALLVTAYVMLVLSWISVSLRSYARAVLTKGFLADDWLMLASQLNFTISCSFIITGCYNGLGRHNRSLSVHDEVIALKWQVLATITYVLNMWLIKMSIGIFLLRIATQRRYRYTLYVAISIVTVWSLVLFFWNLFQCKPVEAQWDYTILSSDSNSHCVSVGEVVNAAYALSAMTVLSDWLFALLPIPMVWNVKMTMQAKLTVMAILGVGIFASVATLVRLKFLADLTDVSDILFAGTNAMVWTLIEPGLAIVASSLATIRPLLRAWNIRGFQTTERSTSAGYRSSAKQRTRTIGSNKMPGFGSADVSLADMETGVSRSDNSSRMARNGGGGEMNNNHNGGGTGSWGSSSKGAPSMTTVQELEERQGDIGTATTSNNKTRQPPLPVESGSGVHHQHRSENQRSPGSGTQYVTSISHNTSAAGANHSNNNDGPSAYGVGREHVRLTGVGNFQSETFFEADQGSISTIELVSMEPQDVDDESSLPQHGAPGRRR